MVTVTASPTMANASDVASMAAETKPNWGLLMKECRAGVEGVAITESGRQMEEIKQEVTESNRATGRKMRINGSICIIIVLALGIALVSIVDGEVPSFVVVAPSVLFAPTAFWGFVKMRSK